MFKIACARESMALFDSNPTSTPIPWFWWLPRALVPVSKSLMPLMPDAKRTISCLMMDRALCSGASPNKSSWPLAAAMSAGRLLPVSVNSPTPSSALALASASLSVFKRSSLARSAALTSSGVCPVSASSFSLAPGAPSSRSGSRILALRSASLCSSAAWSMSSLISFSVKYSRIWDSASLIDPMSWSISISAS